MEKPTFDPVVGRRGFIAGAGALAAAGLAGCAGAGDAGSGATGSSAAGSAAAEATEVRVASLKGPTSIGLVSFMDKAEHDAGSYDNAYSFQISASADEILPSVIKGDLDIALIPANAAAVLYNKTKAGVTCLNVNTLGVLSVVTGDTSVTEFTDLAGRTVYLTGKGATPEYAMNYLLEQAGIADQVTLEFKSEATEVVSVLAADATAVGVLPQPFVTSALAKNNALSAPIDLTDVWAGYAKGTGSQLLTGVTVVRDAFLKDHADAVREFADAQAASVKAVNDDPQAAAPLVVAAGIIDAEAIAAKAIPSCHLVCLTGKEMEDALSGYLEVLYDADPSSVGGELPGNDFYDGAEGA